MYAVPNIAIQRIEGAENELHVNIFFFLRLGEKIYAYIIYDVIS